MEELKAESGIQDDRVILERIEGLEDELKENTRLNKQTSERSVNALNKLEELQSLLEINGEQQDVVDPNNLDVSISFTTTKINETQFFNRENLKIESPSGDLLDPEAEKQFLEQEISRELEKHNLSSIDILEVEVKETKEKLKTLLASFLRE